MATISETFIWWFHVGGDIQTVSTGGEELRGTAAKFQLNGEPEIKDRQGNKVPLATVLSYWSSCEGVADLEAWYMKQ